MELGKTISTLIEQLQGLSVEERINAENEIKLAMHQGSPMKNEPVNCVIWVPCNKVYANDYNPNSVAPPEMQLLKISIGEDGYTQPIVSFKDPVNNNEKGDYEVIDGFHRHRVGKEDLEISTRIHGHLPLVVINGTREDKGDRMASTIRHNRARGKHKIDAMSEIVVDLKKRNWSDEKIAKNLGMDPDEVLRLAQISGLAEMFQDGEFSQAWEAGAINNEDNLIAHEE